MEDGCLGYPGASNVDQPAHRLSTSSMAGNPRNAAMTPHTRPADTCHTGLTVEKEEGRGEQRRKLDKCLRMYRIAITTDHLTAQKLLFVVNLVNCISLHYFTPDLFRQTSQQSSFPPMLLSTVSSKYAKIVLQTQTDNEM